MAYKLSKYRTADSLTLFNGDFFGTSELSILTGGNYAPEIMNALEIDAAIYGNHEFDHGLEKMVELVGQARGRHRDEISGRFSKSRDSAGMSQKRIFQI